MTHNKNKIVQLNFINIKSLLLPGNETQNRKKVPWHYCNRLANHLKKGPTESFSTEKKFLRGLSLIKILEKAVSENIVISMVLKKMHGISSKKYVYKGEIEKYFYLFCI